MPPDSAPPPAPTWPDYAARLGATAGAAMHLADRALAAPAWRELRVALAPARAAAARLQSRIARALEAHRPGPAAQALADLAGNLADIGVVEADDRAAALEPAIAALAGRP